MATEAGKPLTERQVYEALWAKGELRFLTKEHRQRDLYDFIHAWKRQNLRQYGPIVLNCHRRLGKSWLLGLLLVERCLKYPNQVCRFIAPSYKQGRMYFKKDIMPAILRWCPPWLRPKQVGDEWWFSNPSWPRGSSQSVLELVGVKDGGDALRGPRMNFGVLDECREMAGLQYLLDDILIYQFAKQHLPLLILSSTPPQSMAHQFVSLYIPQAKDRGTYMLCPVHDDPEEGAPGNPDFTEEDLEAIRASGEVGAEDSASWLREMQCKLISDPKGLIVPEFPPIERQIVRRMPLPAWFDAYTAIDFGWQDHNGALLAYLDFLSQKLVIRGEIWLHNVSTGQLAKAIREMERKLWWAQDKEAARCHDKDETWLYRDLSRVGDHSKQQLADLWLDHSIDIRETDKWDFDAALANVRFGIQTGKILIDPDCVHLREQLRHGTWKESLDGARRTFTRDNVLGHCDLIAALNYLYRSVNWTDNPFPEVTRKKSQIWDAEEEAQKEPSARFKSMPLDWKTE